MRKRFYVTKGLIFAFICLILGVVFLHKGFEVKHNYNNSINLEELEGKELETGKIVVGKVEDYVQKEIINLGSGDYSGVMQTYLSGNKEYDIYLVKLVNDEYIQLMIGERQSKDILQDMNKNSSMYFEGVIEKSPFLVNYDWCEGLDEKIYPNIKNNIISEYVVREVDLTQNDNNIYGAIMLIIVSLIVLFCTGGIQKTYVLERTDNDKKYNRYVSSYNNENELLYENEYLSKLMNDMKELEKKRLKKILIVIIGIFVFGNSYYIEMKLVGIVIVMLGLKGIWGCFINSSNTFAVKIAKKYDIESTYLKIMQCKDNIKELEDLIRNKSER